MRTQYTGKPCLYDGCEKISKCRGWCNTHYERWRRNGTVDIDVELHGKCRTTEYRSWNGMKNRCNNPNDKNYDRYGGRGIRVCDRWNRSFVSFLEDMGEKPEGTTLDRIDVNGNYEPSNCRWATPLEQSNNQRTNVKVTYKGKTMNISQWARELGIAEPTLRSRLKVWSVDRAFEEPIDEEKQRISMLARV